MKRNQNYVFVSKDQFAKILSILPMDKEICFTLHDDPDLILTGTTPEGWFCAKRTQIFNDFNGVLAIGYMGGGHTVVYNPYDELVSSNSEIIIEEYLEDYLLAEFVEDFDQENICLEITDENRDIIEKSLMTPSDYKALEQTLMRKYPQISEFSWNEYTEDGKIYNVVFVKLPWYLTTSSNSSEYFTDLEQLDQIMSEIHLIERDNVSQLTFENYWGDLERRGYNASDLAQTHESMYQEKFWVIIQEIKIQENLL